jgi:four helix bundle protein
MHPLNKLQVYQQALAFAADCRVHCSTLADRDLRTQLLRAARAVAANLAEGAGSESQAVFARHIAIALASARETDCHLWLAREAGLLASAPHEQLVSALDNLTPRLVKLLLAVRQNATRRTKDTP